MKIIDSLKETESKLKADVDLGSFPEWWRLKVVLNFLHNFPDAKIYETQTGSYHLESSHPSSMKIRRAIPDCRGRLYVSDRRFEMIGSHGDIIFWTGKAKFQYKMVKGKLTVKWLRKRKPDREITLKDVLALPWKLAPPQHRKRYLKWWKRKLGEEKEKRRMRLKNRCCHARYMDACHE
ncbi:MAG: hypothetical protein QXJ07_05580 [Candidatus Bathyarchaeia archaeon]